MRFSLLVTMLLTAVAPARAQEVHYEGSLGASTGRYIFEERTTTVGLTTGIALRVGSFTVRGILPLWLQNSTAVSASVPGMPGSGTPTGPGMGGATPSGGSSSGTVGDSGRGGRGRGSTLPVMAAQKVNVPSSAFTDYRPALGDPLLSASLSSGGSAPLSATFTGLVKVPLTDTANYGTGEWDFGAALGTTFRLNHRTLLGADIAFWHLGDMAGLDFDDPLSGTISVSRLVGDRWGVMVFGSGSTAAVPGFDPPVSVGLGFTRVETGAGWGLQASVGLTETSPDLSAGGFWRVKL